MRFRSDGTWLAACGGSSNLIYFIRQSAGNNGQYYVDHTVNVGSYPNSIAWTYNDNSLAAGLANGRIAIL